MAVDVETYAVAKKYTDNSVAGGGAIKGKNCIITDISPITGGHRVTFQWTLDNGTVQEDTMDVMSGDKGDTGDIGPAGKGIVSTTVNAQQHLIITYDDGTTQDAGLVTVSAVEASGVQAGTLGGKVLANATSIATLSDKQVRNIYAGTTDMTAGTSELPTGDIYIMFET